MFYIVTVDLHVILILILLIDSEVWLFFIHLNTILQLKGKRSINELDFQAITTNRLKNCISFVDSLDKPALDSFLLSYRLTYLSKR